MSKQSYDAVYLRNYRKENPGKVQQWELNTAKNKLTNAGYTVSAPKRPAKKKPEDMTDDELREALEEKRRKNREYCNRWRAKNCNRFNDYQKEYRAKQKKARTLKAELDRRQNGE